VTPAQAQEIDRATYLTCHFSKTRLQPLSVYVLCLPVFCPSSTRSNIYTPVLYPSKAENENPLFPLPLQISVHLHSFPLVPSSPSPPSRVSSSRDSSSRPPNHHSLSSLSSCASFPNRLSIRRLLRRLYSVQFAPDLGLVSPTSLSLSSRYPPFVSSPPPVSSSSLVSDHSLADSFCHFASHLSRRASAIPSTTSTSSHIPADPAFRPTHRAFDSLVVTFLTTQPVQHSNSLLPTLAAG